MSERFRTILDTYNAGYGWPQGEALAILRLALRDALQRGPDERGKLSFSRNQVAAAFGGRKVDAVDDLLPPLFGARFKSLRQGEAMPRRWEALASYERILSDNLRRDEPVFFLKLDPYLCELLAGENAADEIEALLASVDKAVFAFDGTLRNQTPLPQPASAPAAPSAPAVAPWQTLVVACDAPEHWRAHSVLCTLSDMLRWALQHGANGGELLLDSDQSSAALNHALCSHELLKQHLDSLVALELQSARPGQEPVRWRPLTRALFHGEPGEHPTHVELRLDPFVVSLLSGESADSEVEDLLASVNQALFDFAEARRYLAKQRLEAEFVVRGPGGTINYEVEVLRQFLEAMGVEVEVVNPHPDAASALPAAVLDQIRNGRLRGKVRLRADHLPWGG